MPDRHYDDPELAALYDAFSGWSDDRDFYLALAGDKPIRVLDVGCGTGLLCNDYAASGHRVTGVDPSATMLDVARRKPHGEAIDWIEATAQGFTTDERFDLAIMTGHAFQVLKTDDAVSAAFANIHRHLAPGGRFAFESRNPDIDWPARWDYVRAAHPDGEVVEEIRCFNAMDGDRLAFQLRYAFAAKTVTVESEIRFPAAPAIVRHLEAAGFRLEHLFGDWRSGPFDPGASLEMIFIARA